MPRISCASSSTCRRPASSSPRASAIVVGGAVLALRPSVRAGGFVGTIDLLVVDPDHDADRVTDALLEERRPLGEQQGLHPRGGSPPGRSDALGRWAAQGFAPAGPRIQRIVAAVGTTARRT